MVFTVTFNPSLDYIVSVDNFQLGYTNRTSTERIVPGGKGLNVAMMLKNLNVATTALGFIAGFSGDEIMSKIVEQGIPTKFIRLDHGFSRINLKLQNIEGTEINGSGPEIEKDKTLQLLNHLKQLEKGDVLVLAGSIPPSMPNDIYGEIMRQLNSKDILTIVDATHELITNVLEYEPFLIKPNKDELEEIFDIQIKNREEILYYARELQKMGAQNVIVSMSGDGAVMVTQNGYVFDTQAPKGQLINSVGSGDSMVAGFLYGWLQKKEYRHAFYMSVAAGSASAFTEYLAKEEAVLTLYKQLTEEDV